MTPGSSTPVFWGRKPSVSACREGDNLILFDPDRACEKVVNRAGAAIWAAMDGSTSEDGVQEAEAERRSSSTMNPHRSQPSSLWSVRVLMSLTILVNSRLSSSMVSM